MQLTDHEMTWLLADAMSKTTSPRFKANALRQRAHIIVQELRRQRVVFHSETNAAAVPVEAEGAAGWPDP